MLISDHLKKSTMKKKIAKKRPFFPYYPLKVKAHGLELVQILSKNTVESHLSE